MDKLNKITQYGDKSVYIEKNSGNIHISSPNGEVKIISPKTEDGIAQLLKEIGNQQQLLHDILKAVNHTNIPHAITKDPIFPQDFIGRDNELKELHKKLFAGENFILLVNGKGGIGKTALAAKYYHSYKDVYEHVGWVLSEKSIPKALMNLSFTLGINFDEKMPSEERIELILTKLANLNKPCLLVIDNVNETNDLEANYLALKRCSNFHLLLTTRITQFEDANFFPVKGLTEQYAIQLFKKFYPNHNKHEDDLLKQLIKDVEHNTLIIELMAKNLNDINVLETEYSLKQMVSDIQNNLIKLSNSGNITTSYHAKGNGLRVESPEDIVLAMYDLRDLSEDEKRMISVFAVLPNEAISYDFLKDSFPEEDIKPPLLSIAKKGWIDFDQNEKVFKVNQVVQDVVIIKQSKRMFKDCRPMIEKITSHLAGDEILHREQFLFTQLLVRYAISIVNTISYQTYEFGELYHNLGQYHTYTGEITLSLTVYKKMFTIFKESSEKEPNNIDFKNGLAISYEKLGETHTALGNLDKALTYFEKDLELTKELYEAYPQNVSFKNGLAISYAKLGLFYRDQFNDTNTAITQFIKAKEIWHQLKNAAPQIIEFQQYFKKIEKDLNEIRQK
ncbi:MAG: tetratricopeptide repeat protein [Ignavibacteriae bacterium]|nr:tetratricopeptide repeat protein [Ignavibacteriota bacterium]